VIARGLIILISSTIQPGISLHLKAPVTRSMMAVSIASGRIIREDSGWEEMIA
jgi:hypothetical protein